MSCAVTGQRALPLATLTVLEKPFSFNRLHAGAVPAEQGPCRAGRSPLMRNNERVQPPRASRAIVPLVLARRMCRSACQGAGPAL